MQNPQGKNEGLPISKLDIKEGYDFNNTQDINQFLLDYRIILLDKSRDLLLNEYPIYTAHMTISCGLWKMI